MFRRSKRGETTSFCFERGRGGEAVFVDCRGISDFGQPRGCVVLFAIFKRFLLCISRAFEGVSGCSKLHLGRAHKLLSRLPIVLSTCVGRHGWTHGKAAACTAQCAAVFLRSFRVMPSGQCLFSFLVGSVMRVLFVWEIDID